MALRFTDWLNFLEVEMRIEIADHVHHRPSGENWVVARVTEQHVYPAGWPPCRADIADCELIHKATPEQVENLKRDLQNLQTGDARKI